MAFPNPLDIIIRDYQALTRRVTAHHILLPKSDDVALSLKQKIRNKVNPKKRRISTEGKLLAATAAAQEQDQPMYVLDAFSEAAKRFSRDEETAVRGGLLGTLVKQGYCLSPELDRACFEVPLGEISGPIESKFGYHLLLVVERTNCPKLDGGYTRIERDGDDTTTTNRVKFVSASDSNGSNGEGDFGKLILQQFGFWIGVSLAGGIAAELAAKAANVIETLPWDS